MQPDTGHLGNLSVQGGATAPYPHPWLPPPARGGERCRRRLAARRTPARQQQQLMAEKLPGLGLYLNPGNVLLSGASMDAEKVRGGEGREQGQAPGWSPRSQPRRGGGEGEARSAAALGIPATAGNCIVSPTRSGWGCPPCPQLGEHSPPYPPAYGEYPNWWVGTQDLILSANHLVIHFPSGQSLVQFPSVHLQHFAGLLSTPHQPVSHFPCNG